MKVKKREKGIVYSTVLDYPPLFGIQKQGSKKAFTLKDGFSESYLYPLLTEIIIKTNGEMQDKPLLEDMWEDDLADDILQDKECMDIVQLYLADISQYKVLTAKENETLFKQFRAGDEAAKNKLVIGNLRLVITVAKRYLGHGLELADLVQEGNIGLINAVEKFDPERGLKFSTCAATFIKNAILRALTETGRTIRLPSHMQTICSKVMKARRKYIQETGREPSVKNLMEMTKLNEKKVKAAMIYSLEPLSLDMPISRDEDNEACIGDFIEGKCDTGDLSYLDRQHLAQILKEAMEETLDERETYIIQNYFGLGECEPQPLGNIGEKFHISRERIRQLEREAISKIKGSSLARILESYQKEL